MATAAENTGPAQYVDQTTGFPKPPLGVCLVNLATLVSFTGKGKADYGSYAYGIGLFVRPNEYHPYVVWTLILKSDGSWVVESGSYCATLTEAVREYERRGGKT